MEPEPDSEREEGEMSDDSVSMSVDPEPAPPRTRPNAVRPPTPSPPPAQDYTILYRTEKHGLVLEKLEKTDSAKLEERARRFGINLSGTKVITQTLIDELYENIGITDANERHFRFDTLHLKGVNGLKDAEIFEYLEDYRPMSLERIDESACNVVCQDHISAALAILVHSREIKDEDVQAVASCCAPYHWREGLPHPKSSLILLRFATRSDKILLHGVKSERIDRNDFNRTNDSAGKNPWGDLCRSWGVYDHQEVYGPRPPPTKSYIKTEAGIVRKQPYRSIEANVVCKAPIILSDDDEPILPPRIKNKNLSKRLGKRFTESSDDESSSDDEWRKKSKVPRMRMRADDEEDKKKSKQLIADEYDDDKSYPSLSIQIDNTDDHTHANNLVKTTLSEKFGNKKQKNSLVHQKSNIQSRLGERINTDNESSNDSSSSSLEKNVMSRVQVAPANKKPLSGVWTRLDKSDAQTDLRQTLKTRPKSVAMATGSDLRKKLKEKNKHTRSPLRIEIDNEYYESD